MTGDSTTLYRPVGQTEFELVRASGFSQFPPRLPEQHFLLSSTQRGICNGDCTRLEYEDENPGFAGYVLRFNVQTEFLQQYEIHVVGRSMHREYWIPASELINLNANIVGSIQVASEFRAVE